MDDWVACSLLENFDRFVFGSSRLLRRNMSKYRQCFVLD
ncbi:hypothetical protein BVRB_8g187990 [Beta vulgaris subsp. vulgaris]|nr:hypothetical protein BVRB_8g187990 [Beta vulgaris subsp. vulgaris]